MKKFRALILWHLVLGDGVTLVGTKTTRFEGTLLDLQMLIEREDVVGDSPVSICQQVLLLPEGID